MGITSRWVLIVLVLAWAVYAIYPISEKINLGLDLQGGMHIVLEVDTDKAIEGNIDNAAAKIRKKKKLIKKKKKKKYKTKK